MTAILTNLPLEINLILDCSPGFDFQCQQPLECLHCTAKHVIVYLGVDAFPPGIVRPHYKW